jgi:hypothetical protein
MSRRDVDKSRDDLAAFAKLVGWLSYAAVAVVNASRISALALASPSSYPSRKRRQARQRSSARSSTSSSHPDLRRGLRTQRDQQPPSP